jgi:site-specific DNA recombinase
VETKRAAKYRRISDDREGRELGVERQDQDLDALGERRGLVFVENYADNDIGASTRSKKPRPDYQRMLADAKAGKFEVIAAYTTSRVTRRPREFEDLIELAEHHGIEFMYVRSPEFDLTTAQGRRIARILAANDAGESEDIAERVSRAARQRAEKGEFHGGSPIFGYQKAGDTMEPHPVHAGWVTEAIERLLAGESLYGVCTDWNSKGRRTEWHRWQRTADGGFARDAKGKRVRAEELGPWYPRTLKRVVTSPTIAGYREVDGELFEAQWESIVDRDDWERVRVLLRDDDRKSSNWQMAGNGNARKYELSGLLFCANVLPDGSVCGRVMVSMLGNRQSKGENVTRHAFICSKVATGGCGSMRIEMHHLERYIEYQVFARLDSPELRAALAAKGKGATDIEKRLRKAIADDERAMRRLAEDYDDGDVPKAEYRQRRKRIQDRLDANQSALADATRTRTHLTLPSGNELRAQWPHRDNVWKRTILGSLIERIDISRHPAGVASNLTQRRNESEHAFKIRLEKHRAAVLGERVSVQWWQ